MEFSVLTEILCVWLRKFSLLKQLVLIILLPLHNFNHTTLVVVCKDMLYSRSLLCLYLYQVLSNALESTRLGTKADICDFFKAYLATDTFQFVPAWYYAGFFFVDKMPHVIWKSQQYFLVPFAGVVEFCGRNALD